MPKAFILAAGFGSRLRPLTNTLPKPLIEIGGKPLIAHHICHLRDEGITEIGINIHHLGHLIQEYCQDGAQWGVKITYFPEDPILGTLGALVAAKDFLNTPFWLVSADIFSFFKFVTPSFSSKGYVYLVPNPPYHPQGDFGLEKDFLCAGKTYTYSNIGFFSPDIIHGCAPGFAELGPLLQTLAAQGQLNAGLLEALWFNIGTQQEIQNAQRSLA